MLACIYQVNKLDEVEESLEINHTYPLNMTSFSRIFPTKTTQNLAQGLASLLRFAWLEHRSWGFQRLFWRVWWDNVGICAGKEQ